MNQLPRVIINIPKIIQNYQIIYTRCAKIGVGFTSVVKGIAGDEVVLQAMVEAGVCEIGDSRLENLMKVRGNPNLRRILLRLPAPSRISETLEHSDLSLNSEKTTLAKLESRGKNHQVILMLDMGDLREGVIEQDLSDLGRFCKRLKNIRTVGVGSNFSCFAGIVPTVAKLEKLYELANRLKTEYQLPIEIISGGNSSSLPLLYDGSLPKGVNHLRIGEGLLLGKETLTGAFLPDLHYDSFIIEAEVIQVQWKPANPEGQIGWDAFGRKPCLPQLEAGIRVLVSLGHQDTPLTGLTPLEPGLTIMGGSSDYLVIAGETRLKVGQTLRFLPNYWSMLGVMTSPYVEKVYLI